MEVPENIQVQPYCTSAASVKHASSHLQPITDWWKLRDGRVRIRYSACHAIPFTCINGYSFNSSPPPTQESSHTEHSHNWESQFSPSANPSQTHTFFPLHTTPSNSRTYFKHSPFRLSVRASGYIINYIWHCFFCVYVCGSAACPERRELGKYSSKTPC